MSFLQLQLDGTADQSIDEYFALLVIDAFDAYERCNAGKTDRKIIENNVVVLMARFVTDLCESLTDADDFLDGLQEQRSGFGHHSPEGVKANILISMLMFVIADDQEDRDSAMAILLRANACSKRDNVSRFNYAEVTEEMAGNMEDN